MNDITKYDEDNALVKIIERTGLSTSSSKALYIALKDREAKRDVKISNITFDQALSECGPKVKYTCWPIEFELFGRSIMIPVPTRKFRKQCNDDYSIQPKHKSGCNYIFMRYKIIKRIKLWMKSTITRIVKAEYRKEFSAEQLDIPFIRKEMENNILNLFNNEFKLNKRLVIGE